MQFSGKNFQPWSSFSLGINGFTVVCGPSNAGKSAIYRALRGLLRNEIPEDFIRNGQDEPLELTLEVSLCPSCKGCVEGDTCLSCAKPAIKHNIQATRPRSGSTKYVVDGKPYAKLAGAIPESLLALGFNEIVVGDVSADPIFGRQNSAQFLLDPDTFKPSAINAILGAFGGTEKLEAGKKEAALRNTRINSEAKLLAEEIRSSEALVGTLKPLVEQGSLLSQTLAKQEKVIARIETEISLLREVATHRLRLKPLVKLSKALVIPSMAEVAITYKITDALRDLVHSRSRLQICIARSNVLDKLTTEWTDIVTLWKQIKATSEVLELRNSKSAPATWVTALPEIGDALKQTTALEDSIKYLRVAIGSSSRVSELSHRLADTDSQLMSIKEETEKTVCAKCGQVWEHKCG